MKWIACLFCLALVALPRIECCGQVSTVSPDEKLFRRYDEVKTLFQTARQNQDSIRMAEICYLLGKTCQRLGRYREAQYWLMQCLRIREAQIPSPKLVKTCVYIAENHSQTADLDAGFQYARRALHYARIIGDAHSLISAYSSLITMHQRREPAQADSALHYARQLLSYAQRCGQPADVATAYAHLADVLRISNPTRALSFLKENLRYYTQVGSPVDLLNTHYQLGDACLQLGQSIPARRHLDSARTLYKQLGLNEPTRDLLFENAYATLHRQLGDWRLADYHGQRAAKYQIKNLINDREASVARMKLEYETEKKEVVFNAQKQELLLKSVALENLFYLICLVLFLFIAAAGASLIFFRQNQRNRRISQQNAALVREQNHRVKNNLQVISSLLSLQSSRLTDAAARQAVEESQYRVQTMAVLHRRLYEGEGLTQVPLGTVIPELVEATLTTYGFERIRPTYGLESITLHADQAVPLSLILNELLTNACKYAFPDHAAPALSILFKREPGKITLRVIDNGPGFIPTANASSFGLRLIDIQAQQLGGTYSFHSDRGTHFTLSFKP
jgi:two-component sensor histidine kinase